MKKLNRVNWNRFKELATKLIEFKAKISRMPIRARKLGRGYICRAPLHGV